MRSFRSLFSFDDLAGRELYERGDLVLCFVLDISKGSHCIREHPLGFGPCLFDEFFSSSLGVFDQESRVVDRCLGYFGGLEFVGGAFFLDCFTRSPFSIFPYEVDSRVGLGHHVELALLGDSNDERGLFQGSLDHLRSLFIGLADGRGCPPLCAVEQRLRLGLSL